MTAMLSRQHEARDRTSSPEAAPPAPVDEAGDIALKAAPKRYVVGFLRRYPTVNTYLGGGLDTSLQVVDGTLRDYSIAAMERTALREAPRCGRRRTP